jgi:hypothetical protein
MNQMRQYFLFTEKKKKNIKQYTSALFLKVSRVFYKAWHPTLLYNQKKSYLVHTTYSLILIKILI